MHAHTFLRTQIRNVPRKWYQNPASTVFTRTSQKTEIENDKAPCRRRTGEALLRAEKFGDLMTADHNVLNEEGESRNKQYAVVV